jgi:hypothetical protein
MARLFALLAALTVCAPAVACMNDSETDRDEQEFRSRYREPSFGDFVSQNPVVIALLAGSGSLLLVAGVMIARKRVRGETKPCPSDELC